MMYEYYIYYLLEFLIFNIFSIIYNTLSDISSYYICGALAPISLSLAQSGQMISSPSVMKPFPAMEHLHCAQTKHWECQCRPSKEMNLVPPAPVMGFVHAVQRFAKSSPKQLAQYGLS